MKQAATVDAPIGEEIILPYRRLETIDVTHKIVLLRVDLNVPIVNGRVTDTTRILRLLPTIKALQKKQAKIVLLSHMGRPKGKQDPNNSLHQLLPVLKDCWHQEVLWGGDPLANTTRMFIEQAKESSIILVENLRFFAEEEHNDEAFAQKLAALGDIYINDAFSCAHRAHASTHALAQQLPAAIGLFMEEELYNLHRALETPQRPVMAIVGGAKVSTKLDLLYNLIEKVDYLVIGGAMANTFLSLQYNIGKSLAEHDLIQVAKRILEKAASLKCQIILPQDVVTAKELVKDAAATTKRVSEVQDDDIILDIGEMSLNEIANLLTTTKTVVWNGPFGAFEIPPFDQGTTNLAHAIVNANLISIAGGGDTVAAIKHAKLQETDFTYVSGAGGAFLEWCEGKELPGLTVLK